MAWAVNASKTRPMIAARSTERRLALNQPGLQSGNVEELVEDESELCCLHLENVQPAIAAARFDLISTQ